MNNREFLQLAQTINQVAHQFQNRADIPFKFLYGIRRNLSVINPAAIVLQNKLNNKPSKFPEKLEKCEEERLNICIEYANKDENGSPIIKGQFYDIPQDKFDEYKKRVDDMMLEYPEIKQEREEIEREQNEILAEAAPEIEFYQINIAHMPQSGITAAQLEILMPIIDENDESKRLIKMVN